MAFAYCADLSPHSAVRAPNQRATANAAEPDETGSTGEHNLTAFSDEASINKPKASERAGTTDNNDASKGDCIIS